MGSYTIEGVWTGYTSAQRRVVHREHTRSKERVDAIVALGSIAYTDGTRLLLHASDGKHGQPINGYGSLIRDCLRRGVSSVAELYSAKESTR